MAGVLRPDGDGRQALAAAEAAYTRALTAASRVVLAGDCDGAALCAAAAGLADLPFQVGQQHAAIGAGLSDTTRGVQARPPAPGPAPSALSVCAACLAFLRLRGVLLTPKSSLGQMSSLLYCRCTVQSFTAAACLGRASGQAALVEHEGAGGGSCAAERVRGPDGRCAPRAPQHGCGARGACSGLLCAPSCPPVRQRPALVWSIFWQLRHAATHLSRRRGYLDSPSFLSHGGICHGSICERNSEGL